MTSPCRPGGNAGTRATSRPNSDLVFVLFDCQNWTHTLKLVWNIGPKVGSVFNQLLTKSAAEHPADIASIKHETKLQNHSKSLRVPYISGQGYMTAAAYAVCHLVLRFDMSIVIRQVALHQSKAFLSATPPVHQTLRGAGVDLVVLFVQKQRRHVCNTNKTRVRHSLVDFIQNSRLQSHWHQQASRLTYVLRTPKLLRQGARRQQLCGRRTEQHTTEGCPGGALCIAVRRRRCRHPGNAPPIEQAGDMNAAEAAAVGRVCCWSTEARRLQGSNTTMWIESGHSLEQRGTQWPLHSPGSASHRRQCQQG